MKGYVEYTLEHSRGKFRHAFFIQTQFELYNLLSTLMGDCGLKITQYSQTLLRTTSFTSQLVLQGVYIDLGKTDLAKILRHLS